MEARYTIVLQIALISVAVIVVSRRFRRSKELPLPPGPPRDPVIGSLRHFPANDFPQVFSEWKDVYGDVVYTNVFGMSTVILNSHNAVEDLVVGRGSRYQNRPVMHMLGKLCGWDWSTTLKQSGPELSHERRLLLSGLGPSGVKEWYSTIKKATNGFVRKLAESKYDDLQTSLKDYVGCIILQIAYGKGIFEAHGEELIRFNIKAVDLNAWIMSNLWLVDIFPFLQYLPKWLPLKFLRIAKESRDDCEKMRDWPFQLVLHDLKGESVHSSFARKSLEDGHDRERVRDAAAILYAAGLDTTYITLSTFVLAMVLYPEVQRKAQSEIDAFTKSEGRLPMFEDRNEIPYYELIVKEVLRWNPPAPLGLPHVAMEEDEYRGFRIPKHSTIIPNIWRLAHDEEIWKDPYEFRPERFIESDAQKLPEPTQFVFGFGKRVCPGKQLADRTVYLAIVHMLALFTVELAPGEERPIKPFNPQFFSFPSLPPVKFTVRNQDLLPLA